MNNMRTLLHNIWIYIYLFDMCMIPTFHIMGLPFKVAYVIGLFWLFFYLLNIRITAGRKEIYSNTDNLCLKNSKEAQQLLLCVFGIIIVTVLGEITTMLYTQLTDASPFRNAIFFYIILIGSMGLGFTFYDFNKDFLIFILIVFCLVNILLSALGTSAPYFIRSLYRFTGEGESKFTTLRIVGTFGNPNATLCVMNTLFMCIIIFIQKKQISVKNKFKIASVIIFPILTNCFINSRGEFLVTIMLEAVLLFSIFKLEKNVFKTMMWVLGCIILVFALIYLILNRLVDKYPTVAYSVERIKSIFSPDSGKATDSASERPFIHFKEFWDRFIKSPIWGTGFSAGVRYPFIRSTERYHNDWFRILGSGGIIGGIMWIYMIIQSLKKCGYFTFIPFVVTAISNTFIASPPAIGLYFMTLLIVIRINMNNEKA